MLRSSLRLAGAFVSFLCLFSSVYAQTSKSLTRTLPIAFEANQGQVPLQYSFRFHRDGTDALFSERGVKFVLNGRSAQPIEVGFVGAQTPPQGTELLAGHANYFLGNDPSRWIRGVALFSALEYSNLYRGIDLRFYGNGQELEHDFVVHAGADPASIALNVSGAEKVTLAPNGDMQMESSAGVLSIKRPVAYEVVNGNKRPVEARFVLADHQVRFAVAEYDHSRDLVIDPVYVFASYLGGTGTDVITAVTTDAGGNILVTGYTTSTDFPTHNPTQSSLKSGDDVFVTKLDPGGKTLVYSTYLGGSNSDFGGGITVDPSGNAIVTGVSSSNLDFPHAGAISSPNCQINNNCYFLVSIKPDGSALNYSGMVGGSEGFYTNGIDGRVVADSAGNAYLAGVTDDPNFPITPGTLTTTPTGYPYSAMFVLKVDSTGKTVYATLVPGNATNDPLQSYNNEFLTTGIAVDSAGNVTAVGWGGLGLPTTTGVVGQQFPNPSVNVSSPRAGFVLQVNATASKINFASYLPGTDQAGGLAIDKSGNLWIAGSTSETDLPVSPNAYQKTPTTGGSSGPASGYIMELAPGAASVLGATYLDGSGIGQVEESSYFNAISLDSKGNVFVAGSTSSADFPMQNPFVTQYQFTGSIWELILAAMTPDLSTVTFGSFLSSIDPSFGGSNFGGMTIDAQDHLVVVGSTNSRNFPTTAGSFEPQLPPAANPLSAPLHSFVAKFDMSVPAPAVCLDTFYVTFGNVNAKSSVNKTVNIKNCGNASLHISNVVSSDPTVIGNQNCGTVAAGAICPLTLTFTPVASAATNGSITLIDDAVTIPQSVGFTGQGIAPKITAYANPLDLGHLLVGTRRPPVPLHVQNLGQQALSVSKVVVSGSSFSLASEDCTINASTGFCTINIAFAPAAAGALTGAATITSNDPAAPQFVVKLTGTGDTTYALPVITQNSAPTVPINAGPQSFILTGINFYPESIAQVNGVTVASTFTDNATLQVVIPASSLQQLGDLLLTVSNPTPGGGTSSPTVVTPYQTLLIEPSFVASVPKTGLLYAAIPAAAAAHSNTVIPVDPKTGTPGTPIPVGKDPRFLAASSDGAYLFVANRGDQTVQRINLSTNTVEKTFPYTPNYIFVGSLTMDATDLQAVPGSPKEVLLAQGGELSLFNDAGLVNYVPYNLGCCYADPQFDSITVAGNPQTVYGLPFSFSGSFFQIANLTSTGLQYTRPSGSSTGPNNGTGSTVISDGTLLYTSAGQVWDPTTQKQVGTFPVQTFNSTSYPNMYSITLDSGLGKIFSIGDQNYGSNSTAFVVSAYGIKSLALTGTVAFPLDSYPAYRSLVRWGADGLAFVGPGAGLTDQELYLIRSGIVSQPSVNPIPVLTSLSQTSAPAGGSDFTLTLTGSSFISTSQVEWNGNPLATTVVSATQLEAVVPASATGTAGTAQILVFNPSPGGGNSTSLPFNVVAAAIAANLSPSSLDFGNSPQGIQSASKTVTLTNTGNVALNLSNIGVTGDYAQTNTCAASLAPAGTCTIHVTFTPTASGARPGTLTITDNAPDSPQSVSLTGTGSADVSIGAGQGGSTTATVKSGVTASYNLAVTGASGFSGIVSLTCTGAPQYANCTLSPSSVTLTSGGTATFTATVTTSTTTGRTTHSSGGLVLALIPLFGLPWLMRKRNRLMLVVGLAIFFGTVAVGMSGCGGGSGSGGGGGGGTTSNTAPGTYTLKITATSGNATTTQNITLIVN
jgi:hypothetical protein